MKGILFKPAMIRAIADGRKTVTLRRIDIDPLGWELSGFNNGGLLDFGVVRFWRKDDNSQALTLKPRYKVGESVYIKEAWAIIKVNDGVDIVDMSQNSGVFYKFGENRQGDDDELAMEQGRWRSPLFMPAWAARYFIKIEGVRAEMVQEITEEDIGKEGLEVKGWTEDGSWRTPQDCFQYLWDSINKDYPFESNPYIFRYEFALAPSGAMK